MLLSEVTADDLPLWFWFLSYSISVGCLVVTLAILFVPRRLPRWTALAVRLFLALVVVSVVADICHDHDVHRAESSSAWYRIAWVAGSGLVLMWLSSQERWLRDRHWWNRWGRRVTGLVVASLALAGTAWRLQSASHYETIGSDPNVSLTVIRDPIRVPDAVALTDLGRPLALFAFAPLDSDVKTHLSDLPEAMLKRIIVSDDSDSPANCHGWAFTGGRYLIRSDFVDAILQDNGYRVIHDPQADDLIIYRNSAGVPIHTGIVKAVGKDDFILIESKWGGMDTYLHQPLDQIYSTSFAYYRSPRPGHLLHIEPLAPDGRPNTGGEHSGGKIPISAE